MSQDINNHDIDDVDLIRSSRVTVFYFAVSRSFTPYHFVSQRAPIEAICPIETFSPYT